MWTFKMLPIAGLSKIAIAFSVQKRVNAPLAQNNRNRWLKKLCRRLFPPDILLNIVSVSVLMLIG